MEEIEREIINTLTHANITKYGITLKVCMFRKIKIKKNLIKNFLASKFSFA